MSNHALFLAVARTAGIRSLGVNHIYGKLREAMPHYQLRTQYDPDRNLATVSVRLSGWWWLLLGIGHLHAWLLARRAVRQSMAEVQADIRTKVLWPKRKI